MYSDSYITVDEVFFFNSHLKTMFGGRFNLVTVYTANGIDVPCVGGFMTTVVILGLVLEG